MEAVLLQVKLPPELFGIERVVLGKIKRPG
jgi:hypothetical protein